MGVQRNRVQLKTRPSGIGSTTAIFVTTSVIGRSEVAERGLQSVKAFLGLLLGDD